MGAGGASIISLAKHIAGSYLGAFFALQVPFTNQRLIAMGGSMNRTVVALLADPEAASVFFQWVAYVTNAHAAARTLT